MVHIALPRIIEKIQIDHVIASKANRSNFFERDYFVACPPRNDKTSSLMRYHCRFRDHLHLYWNTPS